MGLLACNNRSNQNIQSTQNNQSIQNNQISLDEAIGEMLLVGFRGTDEAGNESEVENFLVNNIDKEPPTKPVAAADVTEPTNQPVTVTATFSEDSVKKEYTLDGGETWQDYEAGGVIIIINGTTVGFRGTDAAGNVRRATSTETAFRT